MNNEWLWGVGSGQVERPIMAWTPEYRHRGRNQMQAQLDEQDVS